MMFLGVSLFVVYLPTWLERDLGATANQIALLFLIGGIANVIVGPQAGEALGPDRAQEHHAAVVRWALRSSCCSRPSVVTLLAIAYVFFFLVMVLVAMRIGPFSALLTALVSDERRGSLMSLTVALGTGGIRRREAVADPVYAGVRVHGHELHGLGASVLGMGLIVWLLVPEPDRDAGADGELTEVVRPA
jgi:predicted MFS family arabinose efflux permease